MDSCSLNAATLTISESSIAVSGRPPIPPRLLRAFPPLGERPRPDFGTRTQTANFAPASRRRTAKCMRRSTILVGANQRTGADRYTRQPTATTEDLSVLETGITCLRELTERP